ncbi:MAG: Chromate resistance protein ChrB [Thermomicrobiales bacterium]
MTWVILIYTVPSEPSRKRASIWREIKKVGAVYLRDGVCALPERTETADALRRIAAKVEEFGGEATLVEAARLNPRRAEALTEASREARTSEYRELAREAEAFLAHVRRETEHREFSFAELEELEEDLGKLTRWTDQVRARDYFGGADAEEVAALLARCEEELAAFLETAAREDEAPR